MFFKRKVYEQLLYWKSHFAGKYAALLEGARRVGKTTIAEYFAKNEYQSYIKIDFFSCSKEVKDLFNDLSNLNIFFLRLQGITNVKLFERKSVIILDEIQLFPKARQALKALLQDGRYDYIETGSLISIHKNVKNILIPSEEYKINVYPLDFEEFCDATNILNIEIFKQLFETNKPIGDATHRHNMRQFRIYLAIGGMPQAVEAFIEKKTFDEIDLIKRRILQIYYDDFYKIDNTGYISLMFKNIPSQLVANKKRFTISRATNKKTNLSDYHRLTELIDSKTVLPCYNVYDPNINLTTNIKLNEFKLYLCDVGLFTTLLFSQIENKDIYNKLFSNKMNLNLGYLFENAVAQMIYSKNIELNYFTWRKENSTHNYEIDFFLQNDKKLIPIEVKSSSIKSHSSLDAFIKKYSSKILNGLVISQKDVSREGNILNMPIYFLPLILDKIKK